MDGIDFTKNLTRETQLPRNPRRNYGLAKGRDFGALPEKVIRAKTASPYNELSADARDYGVFTDGSCCGRETSESCSVESHRTSHWDCWSRRRVKPACGSENHLTIPRDCWRRKVPVLYTGSCMVANALWGWLWQQEHSNWQHRGKLLWPAALWQNISAGGENMDVFIHNAFSSNHYAYWNSASWKVAECHSLGSEIFLFPICLWKCKLLL